MDKHTIISIVIPSRNNLKYLKSAYNSIRDNVAEKHEIILLDDASTDGTWEWMNETKKLDENVIIYRNEGPERKGHTVLYDVGAELATKEVFSIFHADMIASPNYIRNMLKYMEVGIVVSATRIEPNLHPSGIEKMTKNLGLEPEEFKKKEFDQFVEISEIEYKNKTTEGIFAPWGMHVSDFKKIGGHDKKLFAPMELEDSDIFNRFVLNNLRIIQSRDSFVYHMTCRGSRFKGRLEIERVVDLPDGSKWYKPKDSEEYTKLRNIKFRDWWRKWHTDVLHDDLMKPITHPRYDIGLNINHCNAQLLALLEPWCDQMHLTNSKISKEYIKNEQPNTIFNLSDKIMEETLGLLTTDIIISFDARQLTRHDQFDFIRNLSQILSDSGEVGDFEYDIFKIHISKLEDYRNKLINNDDFYNWKRI
jgi:glycosyltransferase involved in cell wall biosynthesis